MPYWTAWKTTRGLTAKFDAAQRILEASRRVHDFAASKRIDLDGVIRRYKARFPAHSGPWKHSGAAPLTAIELSRPILDRWKHGGLKQLIGEAKCVAAIQKFKEELRACLAAMEANTPDRAEHAHNLAGMAGLLGFDDLGEKSRNLLAALHQDGEDVGPTPTRYSGRPAAQ